jgi:phage major head subunit gpT-like protein
MPLYTADAAAIVANAVRGEFHAAYGRRIIDQEQILGQIATVIRDDKATLPFGWLGGVPTMRRFVSERQIKQLNATSQTITDDIWESTIGIQRRLVEDEQFAAFMPRVRGLAAEAAIAGLRAVVLNVYAANPVCADGQNLISTTHNESGVNQSNRTNNALSEAELFSAIAKMMQFTDDRGEPMGIVPTHLLVGPTLLGTARKLLESTTNVVVQQQSAGGPQVIGDKNILQGMLQLVVVPWLSGAYANYWFVIDSSREVTAAIFYERSDVPIEITVLDKPDDANVFHKEEIYVGARRRFAVAPGLWQCVFGGIL